MNIRARKRKGRPQLHFNGVEAVGECFVDDLLVASAKAITISITKEMLPLYMMGHQVFGPSRRGIAGTIMFTGINRHANVTKMEILCKYKDSTAHLMGVELIDEGRDIQWSDVMLNEQYTFVAQDIYTN